VTDRNLNVGEPQVALRDLPSLIRRARGRVRRQIHRPQLAHPLAERADGYCQPIRSAITVAGILGYAASNSPIPGSAASTIDPVDTR